MRDLGILPGGSFSLARGINDAGVIVGQADAADGTVHATRWTSAGIEDLGRITTSSGAAASSIAYAVDADGLVVGYGTTDSGALGAVWTGSTPSPVAALTGYAVAELRALNDFRQAVGDATDSSENRKIAVIVDLRRVPKSIPALFDLNTLVMNGAGWTIDSASDINDAWEIVGTGLFDGPPRAILLRPRPFAVTVERTGTGSGIGQGAGGDRVRQALRSTSQAGCGSDAPRHSRQGLEIRPLAGRLLGHGARLQDVGRRRPHRPGRLCRAAEALPVHLDLDDGIAPRFRATSGRSSARTPFDQLASELRGRHRQQLRRDPPRRAGRAGRDPLLSRRRPHRLPRHLPRIGGTRRERHPTHADRRRLDREPRHAARAQVLRPRRSDDRGRRRPGGAQLRAAVRLTHRSPCPPRTLTARRAGILSGWSRQ